MHCGARTPAHCTADHRLWRQREIHGSSACQHIAGGTEVGGILLCLSCHDGNVTAKNMMVNQSYEQRIGLLTNTPMARAIPTLLGNDGTMAGNYTNDHPVGQIATISTVSGLVRRRLRSLRARPMLSSLPTTAGQLWRLENIRSLTASPRRRALRALHHLPQPARDDGLLSSSASPSPTTAAASTMPPSSSSTARTTRTFNNGSRNTNAPSTTQFCRQCHFGESNESNNTNNITTASSRPRLMHGGEQILSPFFRFSSWNQ